MVNAVFRNVKIAVSRLPAQANRLGKKPDVQRNRLLLRLALHECLPLTRPPRIYSSISQHLQ